MFFIEMGEPDCMFMMGNKLKYGLALLLVVMLSVAILFWSNQGQKVIVPLSLSVLSGDQVHLPDPQGKLTWVNAWSSSCAICLKELPDLEALHREYAAGERLQVVAIAMPYDPPNTVLDVQTRFQLTLPVALDLDGQAAQQFAPDLVIPSHHLIAADGRILYSAKGKLTPAEMRTMLKKYLPLSLTQR